jgi:hypothetical protein
MRIEIKLCEIFQNDVYMEKEPFLEASQGNESLQTQVSIILESDQKNVNKRLHVLHA